MDIRKIQPLLRAKGIPDSNDDFILNFISLYEVAFEDIFPGTLDSVIDQSTEFKGVGAKQFNIKRMQTTLLAKGVRIGDDDPVFAMLGLNEIVLENVANVYRQKLKREHTHHLSILSIESIKREKYIIYATCIVIAIVAFFGGEKIEWYRQSLIGIGSMALGLMLASLFFKYSIKDSKSEIASASASNNKSVGSDNSMHGAKNWTEAEFINAASMTKLSQRTLMACRMVLLNGTDLDTAAAVQNIEKVRVSRGLVELDDKREMQK